MPTGIAKEKEFCDRSKMALKVDTSEMIRTVKEA